MQGEDVYTALDFSLAGCRCPHWHRIALRIGGAGYVVLLGVVIALSAWLFQCSRTAREGWMSTAHGQQDPATTLNPCGCSPAESNPTAGLPPASGLCSESWLFFRRACYFIASEYRSWEDSREDCAAKEALLLVIEDHGEMDFINGTGNKNFMWIGLQATTPGGEWTWVNGEKLNQQMFTLANEPKVPICATTKRGSLHQESCNSKLKWICKKEVLVP